MYSLSCHLCLFILEITALNTDKSSPRGNMLQHVRNCLILLTASEVTIYGWIEICILLLLLFFHTPGSKDYYYYYY